MPQRIQLRRTKGWRLRDVSPNAIVVARPSKWGNPFTLADATEAEYSNPRRACVSHYRAWLEMHNAYPDQFDVGRMSFNRHWVLARIHTIRGHDLACWCPLVDANGVRVPCHADILLKIANSGGAP